MLQKVEVRVMTATSEKNSIYKVIGTAIVILNVICAVINFFVVWRSDNFFWALLTLFIYAVSTLISALPFFALHELLERIERLEKATIMSDNEFYERSPEGQSSTWWVYKKRKEEPEEDYKGFFTDGHINMSTIKAYEKIDSDNEKKELESDMWQCSCGKINQQYVGTCCCGERKPR